MQTHTNACTTHTITGIYTQITCTYTQVIGTCTQKPCTIEEIMKSLTQSLIQLGTIRINSPYTKSYTIANNKKCCNTTSYTIANNKKLRFTTQISYTKAEQLEISQHNVLYN